jgi:hypothetical protein
MRIHWTRWVTPRAVFAFTALLAVAGVHAGQTNITVETANSVNKQILGVFDTTLPAPPGSTTVLNSSTDQSQVIRIVSLALGFSSNTNTVDAFAADSLGHQIRQYVGDFTAGTFVCPPLNTAPPCSTGITLMQASQIQYPNGLSMDPNTGNLYAVNNAPGKSPLAQVWALQRNSDGSFQTAQRIDTSGTNALGPQQAVVESMVVTNPLACTGGTCLANTGDLLVVSQNPDEILVYPVGTQGIKALTPTILVPQCPRPHGSSNCIPAGSMIGGVAVWPADQSLIVTTFNGPILQFATSGSITGPAVVSGAPSGLYKVNTTIRAGKSVGFVAQSGPGNHGSILELSPITPTPANPPTIQLSSTSVTAGVFAPQAIAVTNTQQAPFANCLITTGQTQGCDLFGGNTDRIKVNKRGNPDPNSNIVESLCLVALDPRGASCPGSTLAVNDVCPGFDTTGKGMVIPKNACGSPGFALIKAQVAPGQTNDTYIETQQDPKALFSDSASNPVCGVNLPPGVPAAGVWWAPNGGTYGEGLLAEWVGTGGTITNPGAATITPTMVDVTEGCWGDPGPGGGHPLTSVFASGLKFTSQGADLQTFVNGNYSNLKTTITQLSTGNSPPNVSLAVAGQLTDGSSKCFDVSQSLFNKAMHEGQPQQTYDFQDAADLLTNADTTNTPGTTTCESIVLNNIPVTLAFVETPPSPPAGPAAVYNPSGQLEWRLAEIYNATSMRILNNPPAATWPPPVSTSVFSPSVSLPGVFAQCVGQGCPNPAQVPTTSTLSWSWVSGANNCSWSSNPTDGMFNSTATQPSPPAFVTVPFTSSPAAGTTYGYTLTCYVPATTVPSSTVTLNAPPPAGSFSGGTLQAGWPGSSGSYQVTLSNGQSISPCTFTHGGAPFACSGPAINVTGTPTATIEVSPPFSATTYLTVWPAVTVQTTPSGVVTAGTPVTIKWTPPWGATGCNLITSGNNLAGFTGQKSGNGLPPQPPPTPYQASYTPNGADEGSTVTFTAYCAAGASAGIASITVVAVSVSPTSVAATNSATVAWTPPASGTTCALTSSNALVSGAGTFTGGTTSVSGPADGITQYQATYTSTETDATTNGGIVTFTAACSATPFGSAQLTVTP